MSGDVNAALCNRNPQLVVESGEMLAGNGVYEFDPPLDAGIADAVALLCKAGVETFESCEGGLGHAYPEPTIRFHGHEAEGFRAMAVALAAGLSVSALRRVWDIHGREPTGPWWEIVLATQGPVGLA